MKIINNTKNTILAEEAYIADTVFTRVKGLLGKQSFDEGSALIIKPCNSIHTFFMRFTIDVVFVNSNNAVVKILPKIAPNKISGVYFKAYFAIELPAGTVEKTSTIIGDLLEFK
ncbi:MAG: DUF192 domain-containing protein [Candidatus Omnitrophota bacterium]